MPRKKIRPLSGTETLRAIASGLRQAAIRPNIYGYKPHAYQMKFHTLNQQGRQFLGGNRSGKTVGGATEAVWWATGTHPYRRTPEPPVQGRVVSVDFLNGVEKIVRPEISRWLPLGSLKGGSWYTAYDKELRILTLENGSTIEFMSYDQDLEKFAGTSRHFIWFDEEPPKDIFIECKMRLIDVGGHWWITMTPVEGMTWTYDDIYLAGKTDPNIGVVEVDMTDNPYISGSEIDSIIAGLTADERKARVHGKYVQIGGLIYKMFDGEKHIIDPIPNPPKEFLWTAGMDHGFNNPTAWLWSFINPDGNIYVFDEHYESGQIVSYHARKVHEINRTYGRVPDYYVGDPSIRNVDPITGTSIQIEYVEHGIPIGLGNNDVRAGIQRVARYLEGVNGKPQLYITRNCVNLLHELPRLRWSTWVHKSMRETKNKKEEQHKKDDHAADALRYIVASRPSVDDGKDIPEKIIPVGASVGVNSNNLRDPAFDMRRQGYDYVVDDVLGSEW